MKIGESEMSDVLIWLFSLLAGIVFTLLLQNPIQFLLTRIFGGRVPRGERYKRSVVFLAYI